MSEVEAFKSTPMNAEQKNDIFLEAPSLAPTLQQKGKTTTVWRTDSDSSVVYCPADGSERGGAMTAHSVSVDFSEILEETEYPHNPHPQQHASVQDYINTALDDLEKKLEHVLECISDELNSEVHLERQHLVLMQEKVDMQSQTLQKEFNDIHKKLTQESTIRAMVQQKYREQNESLDDNLRLMSKEISELRSVVNKLQEPWLYRAFHNVCSLFYQCSPGSCQYEKLPNSQ